jgi:hypothetical protein
MTTTETRTLRSGDRVLVYPSPLRYNWWHRTSNPDWPGAEFRTVAYTTPAGPEPERRNWEDVAFRGGGFCSAPATALWTVEA